MQDKFWVHIKLMWSMYAISELVDSQNHLVYVFSPFIPFCYSLSSCHCMNSDCKHLGTEVILVGFMHYLFHLYLKHSGCYWTAKNFLKIVKKKRERNNVKAVSPVKSTVYVQNATRRVSIILPACPVLFTDKVST